MSRWHLGHHSGEDFSLHCYPRKLSHCEQRWNWRLGKCFTKRSLLLFPTRSVTLEEGNSGGGGGESNRWTEEPTGCWFIAFFFVIFLLCVRVCMQGKCGCWRTITNVLSQESLSCFLTLSPCHLGLTEWAKLAAQHLPLSTSQCWEYKHIPSSPAFYVVPGTELKSFLGLGHILWAPALISLCFLTWMPHDPCFMPPCDNGLYHHESK